MRGVKRCQASVGRMKQHCSSDEFKAMAVKLASALDMETKAAAEALNIHPFMGRTVATFAELEAGPTTYARFHNHNRLDSAIDHHTPEEKERLVASIPVHF